MSVPDDMATERTKAPGQPAIQAEEFALLLDAVQDYAIFFLTPAGEIGSWNVGASRVMGYEESEVLGRHFSLFYTPEDLEAEKPRRELETAALEGRIEDEGWRIRKDGKRFWADTIITPLRSDDGTLRGFAKVTRDMTARREAEEALEVFHLLVASVRDYSIFMLDPEGHVTTWNAGAERIKGYAPAEIIGRHFSQFYPADDAQNGKPQRALQIAREYGAYEDEGWRVRKDGTRFWASVVISAVYDSKRKLRGFAKVTRDITDRKKAEETQRALLEQREARLVAEEERRRAEASYRVAQEANRAKDEFLMTLSHELRTPMTSILGWSRMLPSIEPDDPLFSEAVMSIATGAQLQARLIDDILDVSRIVSGKLRLMPETIDLARVTLNAVDAVNPTADAKQIRLVTDLSPNLGVVVADPTRIQQVIWNLVSNAVKFTKRGGEVRVSARRTASQVQISVVDNGEGIDPSFLPHIFEPFRQAENPQTRVHGGLGLGLSIVRYLAEAHGGRVTAESEGRGKGATFTVSLPVRAVAAQPASQSAPSAPRFDRNRLQGLEVMLVDDEQESRRVIAAVLRAAGATVLPIDSAIAALDAIDNRRPTLVITDIAMPEMDGYAFARALRARSYGRELKIVALSAFPVNRDEPGDFDACLSKPIDPFELVEEIARAGSPAGA